MRFNYFLAVGLLAGAGVASSLTGCTKTEVAPEKSCGTEATVRLCHGLTMACLTEHTTLALADGTRLRPSGPLWTAYLAHQVDGQTIRIGYTAGEMLPNSDVGDMRAEITCLEESLGFCGTR